ncbi:hypothetical protein WJX73_003303 [Symbiochloris irregularis]|uniref:Uncharacterized protein n=1 Tax=Symbiochloris irregularis TaxID=706552 RepID=A0AAW1P7M8_9CHLO
MGLLDPLFNIVNGVARTAVRGVKCAIQTVDNVFSGLHNSNERIPIETVLTVALIIGALQLRSRNQSKEQAQGTERQTMDTQREQCP